MKWKKVKDEMPPLNEWILLGEHYYPGHKEDFRWFRAKVNRPFDDDPCFNPEHYVYRCIESSDKGLEFVSRTLTMHLFWLRIEDVNEKD